MKDQAQTLRAMMAETPSLERDSSELLIFVVNDVADESRKREIFAYLQEACRSFSGANLSYVGHLPLQTAENLIKSNSGAIKESPEKTQGRVMRNRISSEKR